MIVFSLLVAQEFSQIPCQRTRGPANRIMGNSSRLPQDAKITGAGARGIRVQADRKFDVDVIPDTWVSDFRRSIGYGLHFEEIG